MSPHLKHTGVGGQPGPAVSGSLRRSRGTTWRVGRSEEETHRRSNRPEVDITYRQLRCRQSTLQVTRARLRTGVEDVGVTSSKLLNPRASPQLWHKIRERDESCLLPSTQSHRQSITFRLLFGENKTTRPQHSRSYKEPEPGPGPSSTFTCVLLDNLLSWLRFDDQLTKRTNTPAAVVIPH